MSHRYVIWVCVGNTVFKRIAYDLYMYFKLLLYFVFFLKGNKHLTRNYMLLGTLYLRVISHLKSFERKKIPVSLVTYAT